MAKQVWLANDGIIFSTKKEAELYEESLTFVKWYEQNSIYLTDTVRAEFSDIKDWIEETEDKETLIKFLHFIITYCEALTHETNKSSS